MDLEARERSLHAVRAEIDDARAAALGRTGRKIEAFHARCQELHRAFHAAADPHTAEEIRRHHRSAREAFEHAKWQLCVQREALGLYDHAWVERLHPAPPRL